MHLRFLLISFSLSLLSTARLVKRHMPSCQYTCFLNVCQPRCGFFPSTIFDQMCLENCHITCGMECEQKDAVQDYYDKWNEKNEPVQDYYEEKEAPQDYYYDEKKAPQDYYYDEKKAPKDYYDKRNEKEEN